MSSRDLVLSRIRHALSDDSPAESAVPRRYLREHGERSTEQKVGLLADNLADYRANVHRVSAADLPELIARLLTERGAGSVLMPDGLSAGYLEGVAVRIVPEHPDHTPADLDAVDAVVTGCAIAIAETGTIVLDSGPGQGRRRSTLIPDHHICVVHVPYQVVASVPQALERLDPTRPLTWISGPSATSDIELDRVEGVHGPRRLDVILIAPQ